MPSPISQLQLLKIYTSQGSNFRLFLSLSLSLSMFFSSFSFYVFSKKSRLYLQWRFDSSSRPLLFLHIHWIQMVKSHSNSVPFLRKPNFIKRWTATLANRNAEKKIFIFLVFCLFFMMVCSLFVARTPNLAGYKWLILQTVT